ncbi:hypothetical protein [Propionibacterium sp. oral taxon 192]|uniref:hypothetical protein n=1 Tax=Propionibacterium sp. oral taxon 192 TaxID=671222 RepID=UPI001E3103BA|nr:hypothetical protein [Propionibacterium sp. oral taxon 192]
MIPDQLRKELQSIDFVDRVAEIFDAASEVENDHQSWVDFVGSVSGKTRSLCVESCAQFAKLRRQPFPLAPGVGF